MECAQKKVAMVVHGLSPLLACSSINQLTVPSLTDENVKLFAHEHLARGASLLPNARLVLLAREEEGIWSQDGRARGWTDRHLGYVLHDSLKALSKSTALVVQPERR